MKREPTYRIEKGHICVWDGNKGYTPVAKVVNDVHCQAIVRTLRFAEDCEELIDYRADIKDFRDCFGRYIGDVLRGKDCA